MSSNALKAVAAGLVFMAVIMGFVAYKLTPGLQSPPEQTQAQPAELDSDQVLAVIAVERITAYEPIKAESVVLAPIAVEPDQYYTDTRDVVGRIPLRDISMGIPVTDESFSAANTLAHAIPDKMRAMSLEISDVVAVGGFVKPGDIVDVLVYIRSSGRQVEDSQARMLLKKARVLAYEERLINAAAEDQEGDGQNQRRQQRTAVIAVPQEDTTRVMLGASLGELRLALRPAEDISFKASADQFEQPPGSTTPEEGEAPPETLAPRSRPESVQASAGSSDAKDSDKEDEVEPITLSELAGIKKKRSSSTARRAPPRATIEIYEGPKRSTVTRSY